MPIRHRYDIDYIAFSDVENFNLIRKVDFPK